MNDFSAPLSTSSVEAASRGLEIAATPPASAPKRRRRSSPWARANPETVATPPGRACLPVGGNTQCLSLLRRNGVPPPMSKRPCESPPKCHSAKVFDFNRFACAIRPLPHIDYQRYDGDLTIGHYAPHRKAPTPSHNGRGSSNRPRGRSITMSTSKALLTLYFRCMSRPRYQVTL